MASGELDLIDPPLPPLRMGNQTGLGLCKCDRCGTAGKVLPQSIRRDHLETKFAKERHDGNSNSYERADEGLPRTPEEIKDEYKRIKLALCFEFKTKALGDLEEEWPEDTPPPPYTISPPPAAETPSSWETNKMKIRELRKKTEAKAARVTDIYMFFYYLGYTNHAVKRATTEELFGPERLLREVCEFRLEIKRLEIESLWARVEELRAKTSYVSLSNSPSRTGEGRQVRRSTLDDEAGGFIPLMKDIEYVIWLTNQAICPDWNIGQSPREHDVTPHALQVFKKFYFTRIHLKANFTNLESISRMGMRDYQPEYIYFLTREWDHRVHKDIRRIALSRVIDDASFL
ncbi:hypothetical protein TWF481_003997 [Arthrobotrys musiformis]|uniref:Uncharacterized protein n=1 Tax=Arthrobotrys musiformis TaxID=47236 RepID=A0AAV9WI68_9PEZI